MNDEELTKLAEEELLKEAQRAAARAEIIGPEGWRKCPSRNVNKRFLVSTIRDAIYTNKRVKFKHKNVYYRETKQIYERPEYNEEIAEKETVNEKPVNNNADSKPEKSRSRDKVKSRWENDRSIKKKTRDNK